MDFLTFSWLPQGGKIAFRPPSHPGNVVPLFKLPLKNNKHTNFEWKGQARGVDSYVLWSYPIWVQRLNNFVANCVIWNENNIISAFSTAYPLLWWGTEKCIVYKEIYSGNCLQTNAIGKGWTQFDGWKEENMQTFEVKGFLIHSPYKNFI